MSVLDKKVDVLVIGSGAGALTAACRAADQGAQVLVVEKAGYYGGTSASSGGGLWIPNNHLMKAAGIDDSEEEALTYLRTLTGDDVAPDVVEAYVRNAPLMLRYLEENTKASFESMVHYADYYQELEGAKPGGRSIDPLPYHARDLGQSFATLGRSHIQTTVMGLMGYTNQEGAVLLSKAPGWLKVVLKLVVEYGSDIVGRLKSRRSRRLVMGNALVGRLRHSLDERGVELWLNSPVTELVVEAGKVVGAVVSRGGSSEVVRAKRGVIIGAGGFEHSQAMRERYLPRPSQTSWSAASPNNTGDLIEAAHNIGAALHLMDEAWWGPTIVMPQEDRARMLFSERSMPGCIMVNGAGKRFVNESVAYTTAVQAMYKDANGNANLPVYAIFDSRYRREYPFGPLLPKGMKLDWLQPKRIRHQFLKQSDTIEGLAKELGVNPVGLKNTVESFNGYAEVGVDKDFHRGENSYDLLYGDIRLKPNPCLAAIAEAPFYGVEIFPGDIGTKGGLLTNANAQVLDEAGEVIRGLYAIGNSAASPMGRYYPGAGATLGPAMTFGFIAANHACNT
ncbi:FAD-dependent oxidoreductase [Parahaliea sp. F7430]|uniref:3-oxosteroid 1-dehydrogenase n=1 Tax=Sediminihaliea albiluteola TaxID=2758564 RepID=A0A7W2TU91_9GAMM|nr:FAD-dependent oxidoreductase [Sediminihaliea albiluteola]MBA6412074.1 FAD-dependent oxidoreductase [Sediminihaliea albiluteola]